MSISEKSNRNGKMSFKVMENLLDSSKSSLNALLCEADDILLLTDDNAMKSFLRKLKAANNSYREHSISLSNWYRRNGSHSSTAEINEDRRHLYDEYRLAYKSVNERITELGFVPGSSVGDPSEYNDVNPKVTEWLEETGRSSEIRETLLQENLGISDGINDLRLDNDNDNDARQQNYLRTTNDNLQNTSFSVNPSVMSMNDSANNNRNNVSIPSNVAGTSYFGFDNLGNATGPIQTSVKNVSFHGMDNSGNVSCSAQRSANNTAYSVLDNLGAASRPIQTSVKNVPFHGLDNSGNGPCPLQTSVKNVSYYGVNNGNASCPVQTSVNNSYSISENFGNVRCPVQNNVNSAPYSIFDDFGNVSRPMQTRVNNTSYSGFNNFENVSHPVQCNFSAEGYAYTAAPPNPNFIPPSSKYATGAIPKRYNDPPKTFMPIDTSSFQPTRVGASSSLQGPRMNCGFDGNIGRAPIRNEAVREQLRVELMRGNPHLTFDGTKPEEFWGWHDEISSKFIAAGFESYPRDMIQALRVHTDKRPRQTIVAYINAGIDDPHSALNEIWGTLKERYGSNDIVASCITRKIDKLKNVIHEDDDGAMETIEDLHALCLHIRRLSSRCESLRHYASPEGMKILWRRMPDSFRKRWKVFYSDQLERGLPITFDHLLEHINRFIRINSNPMFKKEPTRGKFKTLRTEADSHSTTVAPRDKESSPGPKSCPFHPDSKPHSLSDCIVFKKYSYDERRQYAIKNRLCFNCLKNHLSTSCKANAKCSKCEGRHITVMHNDKYKDDNANKNKRDKPKPPPNENDNRTLCTTAKENTESKVCSKTLPVLMRSTSGQDTLKCLAIIDEQSNKSFIDQRLVDLLKIPEQDTHENTYTLTTLESFKSIFDGLRVDNLEVKAVSGGKWIKLPPVLTHPGLPDTSSEVAGPDLVRKFRHIRKFAESFPPVDPSLQVMLIVGTNCGEAMHTRCYGATFPFVHKTALGYALVGPVCVGNQDQIHSASVLRTRVENCEHFTAKLSIPKTSEISLSKDIFLERPDDELPGCSKEDQEFLRIVASEIRINEENKIEIPLPFKPKPELPQNRLAVYRRASNTLSRISKDPETADQCKKIVQGYLERGHVKQLSAEEGKTARTFIPVFTVKNERKGKLRIVFDSSAKFKGVSLNDCLYQGPDQVNRLTGVLMRFRHNAVAFSADIETMFHCFAVPESQQKSQCFFWYEDNIPGNKIVPYAARVHIFGHTSSPSVATYGLRHTTVETGTQNTPAGQYIRRNFYVDDGLRSENTVEDAINTLTEARKILSKFGIRLHKIVSTHPGVLDSFPPSEIAEKLDHVNISNTPEQSALGIRWNVTKDELHLSCETKNIEFTRRGILRALGFLYDPLGIAAPVALTGRLLQRKMFQATSGDGIDWDKPLPEDHRNEWEAWLTQLPEVSTLRLRRCYRPPDFGPPSYSELHVFCDASNESVGHVIYIRQFSENLHPSVAFVFGSSRVSPKAATSIPRLELCAALYAVQSYQHIINEIDITFRTIHFYSDSKVVLGYLKNRTKRFSRYITSRVGLILAASKIDQWNYVESENNPADIATRPHTPRTLIKTTWFSGPSFLRRGDDLSPPSQLDEAENLPEVINEASILSTKVGLVNPVLQHLLKFSNWKKLVRVTARVFQAIQIFKRRVNPQEPASLARSFVLKQAQIQSFPEAYAKLEEGSPVPAGDRLAPLSPWLDENGIMRVGGRLQRGDFTPAEKHPILLPNKHQVTALILSSCHESTYHQGRLITSAALREAGYHILNPRNVITSFINSCTICKWLRGKFQIQQMAQLPHDRVERTAPFENCGMDVFRPLFHLQWVLDSQKFWDEESLGVNPNLSIQQRHPS